jgi:flagellin-like protein
MVKRVIFGKKGLSPVIASVLLIMLVLVLAAMIFLWARGFITEQVEKFGQPITNLCESVDFEAELLIGAGGKRELEVVNRGNIDIFHFDVKKFKGGDSEIGKFKFSVDAGDATKEEVEIAMEDGAVPEKITVYPALIGTVKGKDSNKAVVCMEQGVDIQIN